MDRGSPSPSSCSELSDVDSQLLDGVDCSERMRDILKSVIKSRKSWKSFKDGEVVWSLELEAALLEGLENYVPQDTRETRILGRFPMRNRFVSDYIYKKTGKRRTAKQVGSRIQQLRDSCAGRRLLELLRPYPQSQKAARRSISPISSGDVSGSSLRCDTDTWSDASSIKSPITPLESTPTGCDDQALDGKNAEAGPLNVIYVDIVPPDYNLDLAEAELSGSYRGSSHHLSNDALDVNYIQISQQPRHLRNIDPTVALVSRAEINAYSICTVRVRDTIIFTEVTTLVHIGPLKSGESDGPQLYRTTLVPGYWERISNSTDPTRYTIEQKVHQDISAASASPLFSAIYKFRFAQKPQTACFPQPYQQPSEITLNLAESTGSAKDKHSHPSSLLPSDYSSFDTPSLLDLMDHLISFDDDDALTELELLQVQQTTVLNSPSVHSNASSPQISVSPASSCMSATPSTTASLVASPTLYPVPNGSGSTFGLQSIQDALSDKFEFDLGSDYFLQDFFGSSSYEMDITCALHNL